MGSLPANDRAFRDLPLVAQGPWCPEVEETVERFIRRERLHLAALIANAARKARQRGDGHAAARFMRKAARQLREWQGE